MRILLVHNRYRSDAPSGENRVVDEEFALLVGAGHDVEAFQVSSDTIGTPSPVRTAMVAAEVVWARGSRLAVRAAIERFRPDVVHVHNTFPLLSASILSATRDADVAVVATLHNYRLVCAGGTLYRDGRPCHECLGRSPLPGVRHGCYRSSSLRTVPNATSIVLNTRRWQRDVDAFIALSSAEAEIFVGEGFPADRFVVKPNFVRDPGRTATTREHFLYLGRLAPEKGLDVLQAAWRDHAPEGGFRHRLVIAGGGPMDDQIRAWADTDDTVEFLGHRTPAECSELLARSLAVVVPSVWEETFGLVVVEAKAAGVATIATDHASFPDLVAAGRDGLLVPPGDAAALAGAIAELDQDAAKVLAMGTAARESYAAYTPERNLELLEQVYERAIHERSHRPRRRPERRAT